VGDVLRDTVEDQRRHRLPARAHDALGHRQIDGKYIGGHIKPENKKEDRVDRRLKENQNGKRLCVLSLRESNPDAPNRTFTRVVLDENAKAAWAASRDYVAEGAVLIADEHSSYDDLVGLAELRRVNQARRIKPRTGRTRTPSRVSSPTPSGPMSASTTASRRSISTGTWQ
jgi:hypothetical protein